MDIKIPPHLAYVGTLPCETLLSAKQAINVKLQGSVVIHLRCGGVVNNQIKKVLLLSVRVNFFKSVNISRSYKQERGCLMHFARLANTLLTTHLRQDTCPTSSKYTVLKRRAGRSATADSC